MVSSFIYYGLDRERYMKRILNLSFFFTLLISTFLFADDDIGTIDSLAELNGAASSVVNNSVDAITGRYCDVATDIALKGASQLSFSRSCGGSYLGGWDISHQGIVTHEVTRESFHEKKKKDKFNDRYKFLYQGPMGYAHLFSKKDKSRASQSVEIPINKKVIKNGLTNFSSGHISAHTNRKNDRLYYNCSNKNLQFVSGKGEVHTYPEIGKHNPCQIQKIEYPNQSSWHYKYAGDDEFKEVVSRGSGNEELGWIRFEINKKYKDQPIKATAHSSDGKRVHYTFTDIHKGKKKKKPQFYISEVEGSHLPKVSYQYEGEKIVKKTLPDGRYLKNTFYKKGTNESGIYKVKVGSKTKSRNRVFDQSSPVGHDETPIVTHRFFYDIKNKKRGEGTTRVVDALGRRKFFDYYHNRLTRISWNKSHCNKTNKRENFFWGGRWE